MEEDKINKYSKYAMLGVTVCCVAVFLWFFKNILAYILLSVIVALIGGPLMRFFMRLKFANWTMPTALAATLSLSVIVTLGLIVLRIIVPLFIAEAEALSQMDLNEAAIELQGMFGRFQTVMHQIAKNADGDINVFFANQLERILSYANISNAANLLVKIFGNIFVAVFAILFISFFFLKEPNLFLNSVLVLTPDSHVEQTRTIMKSIKRLLTRYFIGLMLECTLIMLLVTAGLWIVGVDLPKAAVIGFVAGMFNVVPYIGPFISCFFAAAMGVAIAIESGMVISMFASLTRNVLVVGGVFFFNAIVTQPFIHSNSVKAHPLEIFLVILMAGSMAGIPGMILAIPSYTLFRVVAKEFFSKNKVISELTKNI